MELAPLTSPTPAGHLGPATPAAARAASGGTAPPEAPAPAVEPSAAGRHGAWAAGHAQLVDQLRALAAHQAARLVAGGAVAHVPGTTPPRLVAVPLGSPALALTVELTEAPAPRPAEEAPPEPNRQPGAARAPAEPSDLSRAGLGHHAEDAPLPPVAEPVPMFPVLLATPLDVAEPAAARAA